MRITGNVEQATVTLHKQAASATPVEKVSVPQGSSAVNTEVISTVEQAQQVTSTNDETKAKVQEAVETMNQMLAVNHNTARFKYHEGLERYYVTVVNQDTDEVVKEIPPKKLLDAFYEMQKMVGMIVDEKI